MNKIRVDTNALETCADTIKRCGSNASSLAQDIQAILSSLPESCQEKYSGVIRSYQREMKSISNDLSSLNRGVLQAASIFAECENRLLNGTNLSEGQGAEESSAGGSESNKWKKWPLSWIDKLLDELGINKYGRDYEDPGSERQKAQDDLIRSNIEDLFQNGTYSKEAWEKASLEEKKKMMNQLVKDLNGIYGTNITKQINFFNKKPDSKGCTTLGYYTDSQRQVSINVYAMENFSYEQMMNTVVHEMRHAYQHEVVRHPDRYVVSEETAKAWEYNFKHYIQYTEKKNNYDAYRHQAVEQDAHDIADNIRYR